MRLFLIQTNTMALVNETVRKQYQKVWTCVLHFQHSYYLLKEERISTSEIKIMAKNDGTIILKLWTVYRNVVVPYNICIFTVKTIRNEDGTVICARLMEADNPSCYCFAHIQTGSSLVLNIELKLNNQVIQQGTSRMPAEKRLNYRREIKYKSLGLTGFIEEEQALDNVTETKTRQETRQETHTTMQQLPKDMPVRKQ